MWVVSISRPRRSCAEAADLQTALEPGDEHRFRLSFRPLVLVTSMFVTGDARSRSYQAIINNL